MWSAKRTKMKLAWGRPLCDKIWEWGHHICQNEVSMFVRIRSACFFRMKSACMSEWGQHVFQNEVSMRSACTNEASMYVRMWLSCMSEWGEHEASMHVRIRSTWGQHSCPNKVIMQVNIQIGMYVRMRSVCIHISAGHQHVVTRYHLEKIYQNYFHFLFCNIVFIRNISLHIFTVSVFEVPTPSSKLQFVISAWLIEYLMTIL